MKSSIQNSPYNRQTPYFYFDRNKFEVNIKNYSNRNFLLYSNINSCLFSGLIQTISKHLDGFTVSSIEYLKKVRKETNKPIHFISPLLRKKEIKYVNLMADSLTFNSISQFSRLKKYLRPGIKLFLRIDPTLSFQSKNSDFSNKFSRFGQPLSQWKPLPEIKNLHIHNNYKSENYKDMLKTMNLLKKFFGKSYNNFNYISLGGGYIFKKELKDVLNQHGTENCETKLIIEPGFDLFNDAGFLVSSVVDLFTKNGKNIAVLDTSVNHLPNTILFKIKPEIISLKQGDSHTYLLTGSSCSPIDIFGKYSFKNQLSLGEIVIFKKVGAYSFVKANTFNGIPIPKVYIR